MQNVHLWTIVLNLSRAAGCASSILPGEPPGPDRMDPLTVQDNLGCSETHRYVVLGQGCCTSVVPMCCLYIPETTGS